MGLLVRDGHNGCKIYSMTLGQNIIVLEIVYMRKLEVRLILVSINNYKLN